MNRRIRVSGYPTTPGHLHPTLADKENEPHRDSQSTGAGPTRVAPAPGAT